jgi:hypothetical protein
MVVSWRGERLSDPLRPPRDLCRGGRVTPAEVYPIRHDPIDLGAVENLVSRENLPQALFDSWS